MVLEQTVELKATASFWGKGFYVSRDHVQEGLSEDEKPTSVMEMVVGNGLGNLPHAESPESDVTGVTGPRSYHSIPTSKFTGSKRSLTRGWSLFTSCPFFLGGFMKQPVRELSDRFRHTELAQLLVSPALIPASELEERVPVFAEGCQPDEASLWELTSSGNGARRRRKRPSLKQL